MERHINLDGKMKSDRKRKFKLNSLLNKPDILMFRRQKVDKKKRKRKRDS